MSYNGGTVLAMAGDQCVCIASDLRFGEQMLTVATGIKKVVLQCFLLFFVAVAFYLLQNCLFFRRVVDCIFLLLYFVILILFCNL